MKHQYYLYESLIKDHVLYFLGTLTQEISIRTQEEKNN